MNVQPDPANLIRLTDTSRCPCGIRCESCGAEDAYLAVATFTVEPVGTFCLTICPRCVASNMTPPVTVGTATRLVTQHAGHVRAGGAP